MGHCFSIPIPCFPTPDINSCNNVAIACCGSTQTVDSDSDSNAGWKGRRKEGEGGRRTDRLKKLYKFAILTVYAVHQQLSKTIQKQQWEIQVRDEEIGRLTLELEDKKTQIRRLEAREIERKKKHTQLVSRSRENAKKGGASGPKFWEIAILHKKI